jgi:hypothetical protein
VALRRSRSEDSIRAKAKRRVRKTATGDLLDWADQAGSGIAKALDDYRRFSTPESLTEAQEGVSALAGVVDVLCDRASARDLA